MDRRQFSAQLLAAGAGFAAFGGGLAHAQGTPQEGTHYVKLGQPLPVTPGKIEVIEFFWYGCPHCNTFEPTLDAWARKLPADVVFRRIPVAFRDEPFTAHQKIFYALDQMGLVPTMHRKVFHAIHGERQRLEKLPEIEAFMAKNGVDAVVAAPQFVRAVRRLT
jgi:thiol:disulfide interchange protein DsbA